MDSFLKRVFVRAGKHTAVHGAHPHKYVCFIYYNGYTPDLLILGTMIPIPKDNKISLFSFIVLLH